MFLRQARRLCAWPPDLWSIVTGGFPPGGGVRPDPEAMSGWRLYPHELLVPAPAEDAVPTEAPLMCLPHPAA